MGLQALEGSRRDNPFQTERLEMQENNGFVLHGIEKKKLETNEGSSGEGESQTELSKEEADCLASSSGSRAHVPPPNGGPPLGPPPPLNQFPTWRAWRTPASIVPALPQPPHPQGTRAPPPMGALPSDSPHP